MVKRIKTIIKRCTIDALSRKTKMVFDRLRGLDFLSCVEPENIGYDPQVIYRYVPSGGRYLRKVLEALNITDKDSIIDMGCGKGNAMRLMLKFPFARVDGIEISQHMAEIAARNFKKLRAAKSRVFHCDAAVFEHSGEHNMFYFFNPFPPDVMSKVIARLRELSRSGREILLIYNNPRCHELIVKEGGFFQVGDYPDEWGNRIYVYSNKRPEESRVKPALI